MELPLHRWLKETIQSPSIRAVLLIISLSLALCVCLYPGLWSIGVQVRSVLTGSYVPGHHSLVLINSPTEQAAVDIGRAIMERRLAASINILPRTPTMYFWEGQLQETSEFLMLVKTKTSKIQQITDYVRAMHPYANPEVLSFPVQGGSLAYMHWLDRAVPGN